MEEELEVVKYHICVCFTSTWKWSVTRAEIQSRKILSVVLTLYTYSCLFFMTAFKIRNLFAVTI